MPTGSIVNVEYTSNVENVSNGMNNAGEKNVRNNRKNSEFYKEAMLLAKKDESVIDMTKEEYEFILFASKTESEDQELEAPGIFMATINLALITQIDNDQPDGETEYTNILSEVQFNDLIEHKFIMYKGQYLDQPDSINDPYMLNQDNSDIITASSNINHDGGKADHDKVSSNDHSDQSLIDTLIKRMIGHLDSDMEHLN
ncbi:hypothetical protein Tco_0520458 [Tanacetum coccineum]